MVDLRGWHVAAGVDQVAYRHGSAAARVSRGRASDETAAADEVSGGVAAAWIAAAGLCCLWICGFDPATDFRELFLMGRSDESESLSGRAFIWPEVIRYARERFWFGYGYEGFWMPARIEDISDELGWGLREAHNGYLEMWLWCGVIGLVFTMFAAVAAVLACLRVSRDA